MRTGSRLHLVVDHGHDPFAPPDALAGDVRRGVQGLVPHLLRRTGRMEPLRPAAQLPAAQRLVAGLHGRPADRRLRFGRLLPRRPRSPAARHGGGPETQNPSGRDLCPAGTGGTLRTETAKHRRDGDGRHERLPRGSGQGTPARNTLRSIRRCGNPLGVRHGRTDLASLLAGRQPLPLPGLDAGDDARRERPVRPSRSRRPPAGRAPSSRRRTWAACWPTARSKSKAASTAPKSGAATF